MIISIAFSFSMYRVLTAELDRVEQRQRVRIESGVGFPPRIFIIDRDLIEDAKNRLKLILAGVNLFILAGSAVLGYFLAGRTLKPISEMVDDQKRFIADASHEMRTPLTAMKTEIEVSLKDKKLNLKQAKQLLGSNLEEVNKMQSLSSYLLNLNQYQTGRVKLNFEKIKMSEVVEKVLFQFQKSADSRNIKIFREEEDFEMEVNEISLTELLSILLDNAIKYSHKEGKIVIRTKQEGKYGIIEIQDFGVGIKEEEIPYIFNRFYRADSSRSKSEINGYGLGLSIAKNIVELHNGKIFVNSIFGEGSTFTVKLPLKQSARIV